MNIGYDVPYSDAYDSSLALTSSGFGTKCLKMDSRTTLSDGAR